MIKSFQHKGLKIFFETGNKAGIIPDHAPKLSRQLLRLNIAGSVDDVNLPGWRLHALAVELRSRGQAHLTLVETGQKKGLLVARLTGVGSWESRRQA